MTPAFVVRRALALVAFAAVLALSTHLILDLNRVKALKTDLGEINNVRYGLLDADQWVTRVAAILERRIQGFELTEANRPQVRAAVARVLDTLLVEIERSLRRHNQAAGGTVVDQLKGLLQQGLQDLLIDFERLRRRVPEYADRVVEELAKPETKRELQTQLVTFLRGAADSTFSKTDRSALNARLAARGCADVPACDLLLEAEIAAARRPILFQVLGLFGLIGLLFGLCRVQGPPTAADAARREPSPGFDRFQLALLTGATLALLAAGVLTPMIEIDARISSLSITLLGEPLTFSNQVLYFQTKSVFDVAAILVRTGAADMLLVAALIVLFSIIFPALKLLATWVYYEDWRGLRGSPAVRFFALRSGKWSMADVLVIAIFMAYIGFSGLVGNQLASLHNASASVDVLTTNGTRLVPGFYMFLGFVLSSLWLSAIIEVRVGPSRPTGPLALPPDLDETLEVCQGAGGH